MITGFNTDIEHDGVVYHVQTEDKGVDTPIILSLVYSGGAILASKRAPYKDLLASGFNEAALAERLKRQHTLICAAIHAGRIEDLKRMAPPATTTPGRTEEFEFSPGAAEFHPVVSEKTEHPSLLDEIELGPAPQEYQPVPIERPIEVEQPAEASEPEEPEPDPTAEVTQEQERVTGSLTDLYTVYDSRRSSLLGDIDTADKLIVELVDEQDFHSGASLTIKVRVYEHTSKGEKLLHNVLVSLKVLGTAFRPQIYTAKTDRNGLAIVALQIPEFTAGRAAILIRAAVGPNSTEIRQLVHPAT